MQDPHDILFAAPWWHFNQCFVVECHHTDTIADIQGAPCAECGQLSRCHGLEPVACAEEHVETLVDDQQDCTVLLFRVDADIGGAGAGSHVPVHGADVITFLIAAQLLEVEPASAQA